MARKLKPVNETPEEAEIRQTIEGIANNATRSEKVSWHRKMDNLVQLLAELTPIEDEILALIVEKKIPIMDKVQELRGVMVNECIHPLDYLEEKGDHVECKFCQTKIRMAT